MSHKSQGYQLKLKKNLYGQKSMQVESGTSIWWTNYKNGSCNAKLMNAVFINGQGYMSRALIYSILAGPDTAELNTSLNDMKSSRLRITERGHHSLLRLTELNNLFSFNLT